MKTKTTKKISSKYIGIGLVFVAVAGFSLFGFRHVIAGKFLVRGNFYFNGGAYDLQKAEKNYKVAAFFDSKSSYAHFQLARVEFMKTKYKDALTQIDKAIALNPEYKRYFYIRGLVNGYAGNLETAASDFQKFIDWAPKEWAGYNDLAWVYFKEKNYQKAADAAQQGLDAAPDNVWLLNGLGVSLQALGQDDKAKEILAQAADISKNMTADDWKRAYPGNNAEVAQWDLAKFKTNVSYNLSLASDPLQKGIGIFQSACSSTTQPSCVGNSCSGSTTCDPDHGDDFHHIPGPSGEPGGLPACYGSAVFTACSINCDCGAPNCVPSNVLAPSKCIYDHCNKVVDGNGTTCTPVKKAGALNNNCCVNSAFTSGCGKHYVAGSCVAMPACVANRAPTVTIISPAAGSTQDPNATIFSISVQDADNDNLTVIASDLTCASIHPLLNSNITGTSSPKTIGPSTLGGLTANSSCTWTVTVSDGSAQFSQSVTFNTSGAASSGGACGTSNGKAFCGSAGPTALCAPGTSDTPQSAGPYADWTWHCTGNSGGPVSCSASRTPTCGWIETNP